MKKPASASLPVAGKMIIVAAVYFLIAYASLQFSFQNSNATPVWPPSGFAFAVLLLVGRAMAPGIFLGAFSVNFFVFVNNNTAEFFAAGWVSTAIGLGNMAEALTGYYLLHTLGKISTGELFRKVNSVYRFIFAGLIMCLPSCTIGTTAILLAGIINSGDYFTVWFTWWTGDVSGILLVTPFLMVWFTGAFNFLPRQKLQMLESAFLVAVTTISAGIVFLNWFEPTFLFTRAFIILPFLIWSSVRLNLEILTVLLVISAFMAASGTISGVGPFIAPNLNESLLTVDTFISFNSVMVLVLHAAILERQEKELFLQNAKANLEEIVHQRTEELEQKNRELEFRNKELASFSYVASHDLQEPLRKIETFSDKILKTYPDLPDNAKDMFRRIQVAVRRMKQLIENLLAYSRVERSSNEMKLTDLNQVLQDVQNDLSEKIRETGAVIEGGSLPQLRVIPFQMQQLFSNIISNAIKFRKQETTPHIVIKGEVIQGTRVPHASANAGMNYYHLRISDNGIGFEPEYAGKIFDIFQRLHGQSEYEGTGIGLAICKKIVEAHQGFITAESQPGIGAVFHIYLPADLVSPFQKTSVKEMKNTLFGQKD